MVGIHAHDKTDTTAVCLVQTDCRASFSNGYDVLVISKVPIIFEALGQR